MLHALRRTLNGAIRVKCTAARPQHVSGVKVNLDEAEQGVACCRRCKRDVSDGNGMRRAGERRKDPVLDVRPCLLITIQAASVD
jgi:hypothetical protein